jgi:hypothetical protein
VHQPLMRGSSQSRASQGQKHTPLHLTITDTAWTPVGSMQYPCQPGNSRSHRTSRQYRQQQP